MNNDRYISEEIWKKEFKPVMTEIFTEKSIMVSKENYPEMVKFARELADTPENWMKHVWSSVSGDDGSTYLVNGTAPFSPFSWFFTQEPWGSEDTLITVAFEDQTDVDEA